MEKLNMTENKSKYIHQTNYEKLDIYLTLYDFFNAIIRLLAADYYYYTIGTVDSQKLQNVINKFDEYYHVCESTTEARRRNDAGLPATQLRLYYPKNGKNVYWILITKMPPNTDKKSGLFFEREKYKDARVAGQYLSIRHYIFRRINKTKFEFTDKDSGEIIKSEAKNGVWSVGLTREYKAEIKAKFKAALLKRNKLEIKREAEKIKSLIGWNLVRKDYKQLVLELRKMTVQMRKSDPKYPIKTLDDVVDLPATLYYIRFKKGYKINYVPDEFDFLVAVLNHEIISHHKTEDVEEILRIMYVNKKDKTRH